MEQKVIDYIKLNNMLSRGDGAAVGVSGGADSMCLLNILFSLKDRFGLKLIAVHVNHGIRGASADADEHFVEAFCREKGIEFRAFHADIPKLAKEKGLTEEEAGRQFRYECFANVCAEEDLKCIAVAHNRDDNAETVLFNIARGSGISGLRGIAPVRAFGEYTIIRPLLDCSRAEIEEYLADKGIAFRTDETNLTEEYSRNRIRNTVIPILKESINSEAAAHIAGAAKRAAELEDFLACEAKKRVEELKAAGKYTEKTDEGRIVRIGIDTGALEAMHPALRSVILRGAMGALAGKLKDIEEIHVRAAEGLIANQVGRSLDLPYGITARRDYGSIVLETVKKPENTAFSYKVTEIGSEPCEVLLPDGKRLILRLIPCEKNLNIPGNDYTKFFDYDKIKGSIAVRTRCEGDHLLVKAGAGSGKLCSKSLKTWFIDNKIPGPDRDGMILLAEGSHVLWIAGRRRDDSCYVTDDTQRILVAELKDD
ncbi:MAG: tRNA lysidine(34) synthetase TilS [Lachnospiraceae bacterium]|nr:tRNA lysidine(34) synthetase TilS [Lachnospiraceae bacterium]